MTQKQTDDPVGFLSLLQTPKSDGYVGALLVCDQQGVPQEFRCTHAVKPTTVQRALYGKSLVPHIGVELCGEPLYHALKIKPAVLVVNQDLLLDVRSRLPCPTVCASRAGEAISVAPGNGAPAMVKLSPSHSRWQPIEVATHPAFPEDASRARVVLAAVLERCDLLEPFDRIAKAMGMLAKTESNYA